MHTPRKASPLDTAVASTDAYTSEDGSVEVTVELAEGPARGAFP